MSRQLSPERRKAVVLAACSGALAGLPAVLSGRHRVLLGFCIAVQLCLLTAAFLQLRKAVKKEKVRG